MLLLLCFVRNSPNTLGRRFQLVPEESKVRYSTAVAKPESSKTSKTSKTAIPK